MISNFLFDWSGTLADDLSAVVEATNRVLAHYEKPRMTRDQFRREFELPFVKFYAKHIPGVPLAELDEIYHGHFDPLNEQIELLPHAVEFLDFCRNTGRRLYILSSIRPSHFEKQARRLGVYERFDKLYTGVLDKAAVIRQILEEEQLEPGRTVFIGDMEHDIATAHAGGILGIGVGTGYDLRETLLAAGADFVVKDLRELRRIMEPVNARETAPHRMPVPTVGALVLDEQDRMLMVHTTKWRGTWGIPGGKMQEGETQEDALRREIREETALELDDIQFVMVHDCVFSKEFYKPAHFLLLNYVARCRSGMADQVKLNEEATEYRWVTWEQAHQLPLNQPTLVLLKEVRRREII